MKRVSSRSLLAVSIGMVVWTGCMNPSTDTTQTASEPLIVDRSQTGGTKLGFYFLPPISWSVPAHFGGVFDPELSPTVRIDQIDPTSGSTLANVATLTGDAHGVRRQPWREFYIARYNTSGLDPANHYRVRVLVDDNELGAADLAIVKKISDLKSVDLKHFAPVVEGEILPVIFRIERSLADQDGDGVPDWKDNCPTIYNPPVPVPVVTMPPGPTPPRCNYKLSACDPQEFDCHGHVTLQQPDVCSCPGNGASCAAPDACHVASMCDPATGACGMTAAPDGSSCSDGNACNGAETCQAGVCTPGAAPVCAGAGACSVGICDPLNGCQTTGAPDGTSCALANAAGTCTGGVCGSPSCASGFADCDGDAANGCEQDLTGSVDNCGACGNVCTSSCDSAIVFSENWESGAGAWQSRDLNPITLVSEASACDTFQRESIPSAGGRVFTPAGISVNSGASYCMTAWIRGTPDAIPFLGILLSDAAGNLTAAEHWLMGLEGFTTGYPNNDVVTTVTPDGNWNWYTKSFTMDAGVVDVFIDDENFNTGSADFDLIQLYAGSCPAAPTSVCAAPVPNCQAAVCTDGVCSSTKLMH